MEPADEDVDIGGNDPPIPCYPPLEIEKDAALKSSKCSSSSSSSSDSDSSSGVCFFIVLYFFFIFYLYGSSEICPGTICLSSCIL